MTIMLPTPTKAAEDSATAVAVSDLRMRYGDRDVLCGVDLTVRRGEVFALLGPNGAGKSTTIEILEGFRRRSGGEVSVLGADPDTAGPAWRGELGIILQSWRDHPRWRVRELLEHFATYYEHPRDVDELLERLGLQEQAAQECQKLSGGQRRRVDVALGIVGNPRLLFLDEPTTGFDPVARREFHELVEQLRDEGMTMVLTTHDLHEAERLADRIAVLIAGRVAACGTAAELAVSARAQAEVVWTDDGQTRRQITPDPSQLVWELQQRLGGPIPGLEVHRPTLEDIYIRMIREGETQ
ncbi:multidrug ABC transporter ATP-binding protein [Microbispora rosea subsp. rosea]|nr:multidrug ABC transporter ATP-binding protein [Microbispora rosea subsp. rosea]